MIKIDCLDKARLRCRLFMETVVPRGQTHLFKQTAEARFKDRLDRLAELKKQIEESDDQWPSRVEQYESMAKGLAIRVAFELIAKKNPKSLIS
jgi:hypothetical protein